MSGTLSEEKLELINNIAKSQGFEDYKIEVKSGSMKGDGYLGIINTIEIEDNRKTKNKLNLILKSALTEAKLRENSPISKAYQREIFMYETVFPTLDKISEEVGIVNKFIEVAKCYGSLSTEKQECIILENLKEIDFKLWNRKSPMNFDHVKLGFTTYAKFHATGLTLKLLKPEKFEELSKNLKNIFYKDNETEEDKESFLETCKKVVGNGFNAVASNEKSTRALTRFTQTFGKLFKDDVRKIDKYSTILHGDCWCNNMMFKYNDVKNPSIPTEMCLLDWQISHVGSPILDLSYFFYACSSKKVLYDFKTLLKIYYQTFSNTLREGGLDPDEVWTYEELEEQWKIYSGFGFFMALFVMKIVVGDSEDAPDLSELAKKGKDILNSILELESSNIEMTNKRISDIIEFMDESGFI